MSRSARSSIFLLAWSVILVASSVTGAEQPEEPLERGTVADQGVMLHAIAFSPDSSHVLVTGNCLRVYNLKSGDLVNKVDFPRRTETAAFMPTDGKVFITAGNDGAVSFWRLAADKPFRVLKGHKGAVMSVAFSPDGKWLASAGGVLKDGKWALGEIGLWNVEKGERVRTLTFDEGGADCVAFSPDGRLICFSKNSSVQEISSTIEVYDVKSWELVRSISFWPGFALSVAFFPDSRRILISGGFCMPRGQGCSPTGNIWIAGADDKEANELDEMDAVPGEYHGYFRGAAVLGAGDMFLTCKDAPREVRNAEVPQRGKPLVAVFEMRETKHGKLIWSRDSENGGGGGMNMVTVLPDGKTVGCCDHKTIWLFESGSGKLVRGIGVE